MQKFSHNDLLRKFYKEQVSLIENRANSNPAFSRYGYCYGFDYVIVAKKN